MTDRFWMETVYYNAFAAVQDITREINHDDVAWFCRTLERNRPCRQLARLRMTNQHEHSKRLGNAKRPHPGIDLRSIEARLKSRGIWMNDAAERVLAERLAATAKARRKTPEKTTENTQLP